MALTKNQQKSFGQYDQHQTGTVVLKKMALTKNQRKSFVKHHRPPPGTVETKKN